MLLTQSFNAVIVQMAVVMFDKVSKLVILFTKVDIRIMRICAECT